jgi:hypothetical protein
VTPWLAAAYAALAIGLAWVLAGGASWKWRAPYIVAAPALALGLWLAKPDTRGWPTTAHIPAHATLQWARVDEPDPATASPGRIYLWLDVGTAAPRAYSVPYSRALHEQVQHALKQVQHGQSVAVARTRPTARRRGSHAAGANSTNGRRSVIRFYPHPEVRLPPKTKS